MVFHVACIAVVFNILYILLNPFMGCESLYIKFCLLWGVKAYILVLLKL